MNPWFAAKMKRHPFSVSAHFDYTLVLTYAMPAAVLTPLLPPGLDLDEHDGYGFLAIALVQARELRPAIFPKCLGRRFFLSGYRLFSRYRTAAGRTIRGLRILRSDTDKRLMTVLGNLLTHYNYRMAAVRSELAGNVREIEITTGDGSADLHLSADLNSIPAPLPAESVFPDLRAARRFAGPLPFTFDYEPETHSIIRIEGVRIRWKPQPVSAEVKRASFLEQAPFRDAAPRLASAFYIENIPYLWKRGIRETLTS